MNPVLKDMCYNIALNELKLILTQTEDELEQESLNKIIFEIEKLRQTL
jgi:hypothetical protein